MACCNDGSANSISLDAYKSFENKGNSLSLDYANAWIKITPVKSGIIRIQSGLSGTMPRTDESISVVGHGNGKLEIKCDETDDTLKLNLASMKLTIHKSTGRMELQDSKGQLLTSTTGKSPLNWEARGVSMSFVSPQDERFYGFGLQFHSLNQRGKTRIIKTNADTPVDNGKAHAVTSFFISSKGYGIFVDDSGYSEFHMASLNPDEYSFDIMNRSLDMYFIYGPEPRDVVERYTWLTGMAYMPPKWGLGFWYRMHHEWNADKTKEIADKFREEKIPCDVIGLEPGWQTHAYSCSYVWNKGNFSDPPAYVDWMRDRGFRLNLWEHAYVHPTSPIYDELKTAGVVADKVVWEGLVPDLTLPEARRIFTKFHEAEHVNLGVSGYKLDECDGSDDTGGWFFPDDTQFPGGLDGSKMHNLLGFLYQQTMHEMFDRRGERTYLLVRASFAGAQRYASCIYSDYYGLDQYIRACVNSGFSGVLWCPEVRQTGSDEEFVRRCQVMFFAPMAMINAWADGVTPWEKGAEVESIFKRYAELRMRLIPYIYTAFKEARDTGISLIRALVMDYPDDLAAADVDNQFMFGGSMMVAPIISGPSRTVYLPAGNWIDYWTGETYKGGVSIEYKAPLDRIPLFIKEGSIISMYPVMQYVGEKPVTEIEFDIYPCKSKSSYTLYEDDGETTKYLKGISASLHVECRSSKDSIGIKMDKPEGKYDLPFKTAKFIVHLKDGMKVASVESDGVSIPGWKKDDVSHTLSVSVPVGESESFIVSLGK
ncbi:MAG: glycoside hydrolase family 31 protein [Armatimonadota bacterium]